MAEPSSGRRVAFVARALLTTAFVSLLGACASQTTTYYPQKGDVRPHPKVARAHTLPIHGIDVSRYQGKIDWAAVRGAGTQFAFIKATEGGDYVDPRFLENWHGRPPSRGAARRLPLLLLVPAGARAGRLVQAERAG